MPGRRKHYDFEEQDPSSLPPAGYLWTGAASGRHVDPQFRLHGRTTLRASIRWGSEQITGVRDPVLAKVTNRFYRGFDLDYPDVEPGEDVSR